MAGNTPYPYPPAVNPGVQAEVGYNNQAYQPNPQDGFSKPPPYNQQYPPTQSPQPVAVGYYPNQYPPAQVGYALPPSAQNQQTTTVFVNAPPALVVQQASYASYCGMIVFACFVFWFFNPLFGLIAFILAVVAENTKFGDSDGARKLGKASMWVSIVGIIVAIVAVAIIIGVTVGTRKVYTPTSTISRRYVSPYTCCSSNGYVYPDSGIYCYGDGTYYSSCPGYYFYYSGLCYRKIYSLSTCCNYNEVYSNSYCTSYY